MTDVTSSASQTADGPRAGYAIEVSHLQTGYLKKPVVHDVSFCCRTGEVTCLFGHNGAGKSSTLKAIAGLVPQYSGEVRLFGEDVSALPISARVRKGVVYLPQERPWNRTSRSWPPAAPRSSACSPGSASASGSLPRP
jgi:ABC-type transport system involved in cytochrome bd biosynthesis fused ATPase/permease subunit